MRTYYPEVTEEAQLALLERRRDGMLLYNLRDPSERTIRKALDLNGFAIKFLVRPPLDLQLAAVKSNPFAIAFCPPKKRGKFGPAVHQQVQKLAFSLDRFCLLGWAEKFDDELELPPGPDDQIGHNLLVRPGLIAFSQKIAKAVKAEIGDAPLSDADLCNLRKALDDFIATGLEAIPLLSWYQANYPHIDFSAIQAIGGAAAERVQHARDLVAGLSTAPATSADMGALGFL